MCFPAISDMIDLFFESAFISPLMSMAEANNTDLKIDDSENYAMANASMDPKNVQELTNYVQTLLENMQDKFQAMSDQIIGRNILFIQLSV
uniref:Heat shock factor-binding protein 1 n=1 Tax=Trichogramma kaykai TaxID=54128 RepID=A0ABD2VWV8_9HYME